MEGKQSFMKIILAFDSFKNCLPSPEIHRILGEAIGRRQPAWEIVSLPLGDGGEGTAEALCAALGGVMERYRVSDPLGRPVMAHWGRLPDHGAVLEMASASGIELLRREELNPEKTSTYGTGELLRHLIVDEKIRRFTIGIGGSATVDGGIGMLQALGVEFIDRQERKLPGGATGGMLGEIAAVDLSHVCPELRQCRFRVACDVTNPLTGPLGAAAVFGPQKGATPEQVRRLDAGLQNFCFTAHQAGVVDQAAELPGDGAAGGLGFALRNFLRAEIVSGAELALELLRFDDALTGADWVVTGEGCSDFQTAHGKLCSQVAKHAHQRNIPVILLSGALGERSSELEDAFDAVLTLAAGPGTLEEALARTPDNLRRMGRALAAMLDRKNSDKRLN